VPRVPYGQNPGKGKKGKPRSEGGWGACWGKESEKTHVRTPRASSFMGGNHLKGGTGEKGRGEGK